MRARTHQTPHEREGRAGTIGTLKPALDLATPEIYDLNAFRLLELPVECTQREISRRREFMEKAAKTRLSVPAGPARILPLSDTPDEQAVRDAAHSIQDAERRLVHEFFWFWPLRPGTANNDPALRYLVQGEPDEAGRLWREQRSCPTNGPAARHNLAILHHFAALELEKSMVAWKDPRIVTAGPSPLSTPEDRQQEADAESHWSEAMQHWKAIVVDQAFWSLVVTRIRVMNDNSLTTGAARRLENTLPVTLTLIHARLVLHSLSQGKQEHARRHVAWIRSSGFARTMVDAALKIAAEPLRARLNTLCASAQREAETDPTSADKVIERLLTQATGSLAALDFLLPEDHAVRQAEHDHLALTALSCQISFGNKTENWKKALELLDRIAPIAMSSAAKDRLEYNRKIVVGNFGGGLCWFCGQNEADDGCVIPVPMHGDVRHMPTPGRTRITWRETTVKVPRCPECRDESGKAAEGGGAGCLGLIGGAIIWGIMANAGWPGIGFSLGLSVLILSMWLAHSSKKKKRRPGIMMRPRDDFPAIKELKGQGWSFGSKPQGIE